MSFRSKAKNLPATFTASNVGAALLIHRCVRVDPALRTTVENPPARNAFTSMEDSSVAFRLVRMTMARWATEIGSVKKVQPGLVESFVALIQSG